MSKENKNVVSEIKNLMVKFGFMSPEEDKKDDYIKLIDGTEIRVEGELAEGSAVLVVTEGGDIPAPDAIHELEDGTKVETIGGIIKSIEVKEESEEIEEEKEEVEVEAEDVEEKIEEKKEELEEEIKEEVKEEIVEKLEEVIEEKEEVELEEESKEDAADKIIEVIVPILEKVKDLEEELKKVKASFQSFKNEPAGKAVNKSKKDFSRATDIVVERILQMKNNR